METLFEQDFLNKVAKAPNNLYNNCYEFATKFIVGKGTFTSEDLIEDYILKGNPEPKEKRVWGAVIKKLSKNKLIVHHGFCKYRNPLGHGKYSNVWKVSSKLTGGQLFKPLEHLKNN